MLEIFDCVKKSGMKADRVFFNILISGLFFNKQLDEAINIVKLTLGMKMKLNMDVYTNLLKRLHDRYIRCNRSALKEKHELLLLEMLQDLKNNKIFIQKDVYENIARSLYKGKHTFQSNKTSYRGSGYQQRAYGERRGLANYRNKRF